MTNGSHRLGDVFLRVLWSRGRRTEAGACGSLTSPQQHGGSRGTLAGAGCSEAAAVRAHAPAP